MIWHLGCCCVGSFSNCLGRLDSRSIEIAHYLLVVHVMHKLSLPYGKFSLESFTLMNWLKDGVDELQALEESDMAAEG